MLISFIAPRNNMASDQKGWVINAGDAAFVIIRTQHRLSKETLVSSSL